MREVVVVQLVEGDADQRGYCIATFSTSHSITNRWSRGDGTSTRGGGGGSDVTWTSDRPVTLTLRRGAGRRRRAVHLGADLVDLHPEMSGQLAGERVHLRPVADADHQRRRVAQRVDPGVGAVQVVLRQHVASTNRYSGTRRPISSRTAASPFCSRRSHGSSPSGSTATYVWDGERLVPAERLQRRPLAGLVTVEGEDHLAAELVVVQQQLPQHPRVVVAERRAAGGDGGLTPARWHAITSV